MPRVCSRPRPLARLSRRRRGTRHREWTDPTTARGTNSAPRCAAAGSRDRCCLRGPRRHRATGRDAPAPGLALHGEVVERRPGPVVPAASPNSEGLGHALSTLVPVERLGDRVRRLRRPQSETPAGLASRGLSDVLEGWGMGGGPTPLVGCRRQQLKPTAEKPGEYTGRFLHRSGDHGFTEAGASRETRVLGRVSCLGQPPSPYWKRTSDRRCGCRASRPRSHPVCGSTRCGSAIPGSGSSGPRRRPGP